MNKRKALGERIAQGRESLGLSQTAFGERLHSGRGSVAAWESGERVPDRAHLEALGTLLGWSEKERAEIALLAQRATLEPAPSAERDSSAA